MSKRNNGYDLISTSPLICWIDEQNISTKRIDSYYYDYKFIKYEKRLKTFSGDTKKLEGLFRNITDGDHEKRDYVKDGIPFYTVKDISEFNIERNKELFISEADHDRLKRSKLGEGNILITKTGRLGTTAIVPKELGEGNISADVAILKNKKFRFDSHYFACFLNSRYGELSIMRLMYGSTRPRITLQDLPKIIIPLPSTEIQKYIGDKIREAEKLKEESKKIEDETKKRLNSYINIDTYNNDNIYQNIKPSMIKNRLDAFYYQEKFMKLIRRIQSLQIGYKPLSHYINNVQIGKKPSVLHENDGNIYFIESSNISKNIIKLDESQKVSENFYNKYRYKCAIYGDLLFAKDGATIGAVALVPEYIKRLMVNDHTIRIRLKNKLFSGYLYYFLTAAMGNMQLNRESSGSAQAGLKKDFAEDIIVPNINEELAEYFFEMENKRNLMIHKSKQLIQEAKQDVEDLVEGNFAME
ncbi:MAG: restriction endonuclease subunit S [Halanaerobiales bacterium]